VQAVSPHGCARYRHLTQSHLQSWRAHLELRRPSTLLDQPRPRRDAIVELNDDDGMQVEILATSEWAPRWSRIAFRRVV